MPKNNLSLGNLFRATTGAARTSQAVSLNARNASAGTSISIGAFAIDSVTATPPTFTYIVESTSENATFTFGSAGAAHGTRVGSVAANYSVTFNTGNFSVGTPTLGSSPSFPVTPAGVGSTVYSEASASLSMKYEDGFNTSATNYNATTTKLLYAVDVYNTINQPDFCLLFNTPITKADDSVVNVEDLAVGDVIKAWVPAGLPDESQDPESDQLDWRFYMLEESVGEAQDVVVKDITFNFASGYHELNGGLIKATGTHPLWIWDVETEKYHFKAIQDILIGDKVITYTDEDGLAEVEVIDIAVITEDVEIVTINVENADVYLSNGVISHNKGTTTQPYIPSAGLRMYLDPSKTASFGAGTLPATGTPTVDWLDLTGYGTGFRPLGLGATVSLTGGANPTYNNGASRKERYFSSIFNSGGGWYKDRNSNINGGSTNFDVSAMTYITWFRLPNFLFSNVQLNFLNKVGNYNCRIDTDSNNASRFKFDSAIASPTTSFSSSVLSNPPTNVWFMASFVASTTTGVQFYLDTTNYNGGSLSSFPATTNTANIIIGHRLLSDQSYQQGPALFFNRGLSSTEITQVYNYFSPTYK
jgi:hypothetical protein